MNTISEQPQPTQDRIIPRAMFRELTGISRSTEWRMNNAGSLPAAVIIDGRVLGYRASAYEAWLKENTST